MLYGPHDSGKTTSLNHLIGLLDPNQQDWPQGEDRRVLINYRGKNIVVTTFGDRAKDIRDNLEFVKEQRFDIFVTAARTRGETRRKIHEYARDLSASLIEVGAYIAPQFGHLVNPILADSLKEVIEGLIKEHL